MKNILKLLGALLLLTGCMSAPPPKPESHLRGDYSYLKAYLSWLIEAKMRQKGIEGLSIAIVDDKHILWAQGFGNADAANKIPATPDTLYRVGSISKLFTDVLVLQLAEQGKLDIDQPLTRYLPDFSIKSRFPNANPPTLRQIMTHHSGLPSDISNGMWTANPEPFGGLVGQLKDEYLAYPPDYVFSYSNVGLSLLGSVLEKTTGQAFAAYAQQQLLKPLGMDHAHFSTHVDGLPVSKAYKLHEEKSEPPLRDMPAGGLNANVLDMGRFMQMVLAGGSLNGQQILKPETLKDMLSTQNSHVALDAGQQIGLGWFLRNNLNIGTVAEHGGATLYHNSLLSLVPERRLGVVVLANSSANDVLQDINNQALKLAFAAKNGQQSDDAPKPDVDTRALNASERASFAGQYASMLGYLNVTDDGSRLNIAINGGEMDVVARADGKFGLRYRLLGLIPIQPDELAKVGLSLKRIDGHDVVLAHTEGQIFLVGEKIKPTTIPAAWKNRVGDYEIINLRKGEAIVPEKCALRERDGFLMLEYSLPEFGLADQSVAISAVSDEEAVLLGLGRGMGETVRIIKRDGKELLAYSGYVLQKR